MGNTSKLATVLALGASAVAQTIGVEVQDGVTRLFGNSFGVAGLNLTYDYIIVGGGTAGNAIAARLALDPRNYTVAVVEVGNFYEVLNGNRTQVPGYDYTSALNSFAGNGVESLTTFDLVTEPQPGYNGREIQYIQGQTFGGSSATNYMGYFRSTVGAFDMWSETVGDDYWSWDNVYPAYKRSAHFTPPDPSRVSYNISYDPTAFSDAGGPLQVSYGDFAGEYIPYIGNAFEANNISSIPGLNSGQLIGWSPGAVSIDPRYGTRSSSETSFLQAAAENSSIQIYPNAIAEKILFDENRRATGVQILTNSVFSSFRYHLNASREVILSAGNWHSPQILMLSGVGPQATLDQFDIPVVSALEGVGQNQRDQPFITTSYHVNITTGTQISTMNPSANQAAAEEYLDHQTGILASIAGGLAIGFEKYPQELRSNFSNTTLQYLDSLPADWPEAEYLSLEYGPAPANASANDYYFTLGVSMLSTSSHGNMTIRSADIRDAPVISPNWLLDDGDAEQAVAALRRVRQIMASSGIVIDEYMPGTQYQTDEEILGWLRDNMSLIYHPSSTNRMGPANDTMSVVDSRARVYGVTGLRVVDASAFPFIPPGQPMSTTYMFAEHIAADILDNNSD